jgi:hypothetical protein
MSLRIRPADLDIDRGVLIDLICRYLSAEMDENKFQWLYQHGAHGPARAWLAEDEASRQVVGSAAAFPRKLRRGSQTIGGFVLGDFCMEVGYRSLGPSLKLQRACLAALEEPGFEFLYDFPSVSMMAVNHRIGLEQTGKLVRWAKPLRAEQKIREVMNSGLIVRSLSAVVDPLLARRGWRGNAHSCELQLHEGLCGPEFSEFDQQFAGQPGIRTVRDAEYLNWRYFGSPTPHYEMLTARQSGKLVGYVVSTATAEHASVVDLNAAEDDVLGRLLFGAVERLRRLGAATVSLNAGDAHPWSELFARAGFTPREDAPIVVATKPGAALSKQEFRQNWFVMRGERDS